LIYTSEDLNVRKWFDLAVRRFARSLSDAKKASCTKAKTQAVSGVCEKGVRQGFRQLSGWARRF